MKSSTQSIFSPRRWLAPLVAMLVVALSACGQLASAQQPATASSPLGAPTARATALAQAAQAQPAAARSITIEIGDNSFTPNSIAVPVGATVVWTNAGQKPHTVTADDGSFTSGTLAAGASFTQSFAKASTFAYFCEFHGAKGGIGMSATIVVADQPTTAAIPSAVAASPAAPIGPSPAAQPAAQPAAGSAQVAIGDNTFAPKAISVPLGATIVWTNGGQRPHTVTADDGSFDSQTIAAGAAFKQTFDKPGTFAYFCQFHGGAGGQGMSGTITVGGTSADPAPQPAATSLPQPQATPGSSNPNSDDGADHDLNDDHGGNSGGADDGADHDLNDDHGGDTGGSDDGADHDLNDDHGGNSGGADDHGGGHNDEHQ